MPNIQDILDETAFLLKGGEVLDEHQEKIFSRNLEFLKQHNALNGICDNYMPLLCYALQPGYYSYAKQLLEMGADPNVSFHYTVDETNKSPENLSTPFLSTVGLLANTGEYEDFLHLLLDHGADIHKKNGRGGDAVSIAAASGAIKGLELFEGRGASITDQARQRFLEVQLRNTWPPEKEYPYDFYFTQNTSKPQEYEITVNKKKKMLPRKMDEIKEKMKDSPISEDGATPIPLGMLMGPGVLRSESDREHRVRVKELEAMMGKLFQDDIITIRSDTSGHIHITCKDHDSAVKAYLEKQVALFAGRPNQTIEDEGPNR